MVGIPKGRSLPLALGIKTRRNGRGLYPRRFNSPMAAHRRSGVSHSVRSTPAVRLPWFSVTRRTANNLPHNERVNIRCRVFTRRQLPTDVAFAIRICIPRTFRSTRCQSTSGQLFGALESADTIVGLCSLMLLSFRLAPNEGRTNPVGAQAPPLGCLMDASDDQWIHQLMRSISRHATINQPEVGISDPLQDGVGFFWHLIPGTPTVSLAVNLPRGAALRAYHVP